MRGAADSFGVVTTFYLQSQPGPTVVNFVYYIPDAYTTTEIATDAFLHLQTFAQNASVVDRRFTFDIRVNVTGITVSGAYLGNLDEYKQLVSSMQFQRLRDDDRGITASVSRLSQNFFEIFLHLQPPMYRSSSGLIAWPTSGRPRCDSH